MRGSEREGRREKQTDRLKRVIWSDRKQESEEVARERERTSPSALSVYPLIFFSVASPQLFAYASGSMFPSVVFGSKQLQGGTAHRNNKSGRATRTNSGRYATPVCSDSQGSASAPINTGSSSKGEWTNCCEPR